MSAYRLCRIAVPFVAILFVAMAPAAMISYDFESDPAGAWDFYELVDGDDPDQYDPGSWNIWDSENGYLELVEDGTGYAMGTAWLAAPFADDVFDIEFRFQPTQGYNATDGFTFGWVDAQGSEYGNIGGDLGAYQDFYHNKNDGYTGYFVEVDYHNNYFEEGSHHIALNQSTASATPTVIGDTHNFTEGDFQPDNWYGMRVQAGALQPDGSRNVTMWVDTDEDGDAWGYDATYTWTIADYNELDHRYFGFTSGTGGHTGSFRIDDVDLTAAPEPTTLVLLPLGLGGLALLRRRYKD